MTIERESPSDRKNAYWKKSWNYGMTRSHVAAYSFIKFGRRIKTTASPTFKKYIQGAIDGARTSYKAAR